MSGPRVFFGPDWDWDDPAREWREWQRQVVGRLPPKSDAPRALRAARDILRLSQREMAAAIGVRQRTLEGWEAGRPCGAWETVALTIWFLIATKCGNARANEWAANRDPS